MTSSKVIICFVTYAPLSFRSSDFVMRGMNNMINTNCGEYVQWQKNCQLLKRDYAPWSYSASGIAGSNPAEAWISVSCECCVLYE